MDAPTADAAPVPEVPLIVQPSPEGARDTPLVANTTRKAWKGRNRTSSRKDGRGSVPIAAPADPKAAKVYVRELAKEATAAVIKGTSMAPDNKMFFEQMTATTRAHILSYLGEDIEAARAEFASELLANAKKSAKFLMDRFETLPPSVQGFVFTAFVDKSELLRTKSLTSAAGAAVGQQINVFMDGTVNRDAIMAQLTGKAFLPKDAPKVVEPVVQVEAKP